MVEKSKEKNIKRNTVLATLVIALLCTNCQAHLGTIHKLRNRDMGRGGSVKVLQGAYGGEGGSPQKIMNYAIFLSKCSSFCLSRIFSL